LGLLLLPLGQGLLFSQTLFWTENFGTGCNQGQLATAYTGINGSWTITNTGTNGAGANTFFVSGTEENTGVNNCGANCSSPVPNRTLHVASVSNSYCGCVSCSTGDCGAAYDACNFDLCGSGGDPTADKRIESPIINCSGKTTITLSFLYMENGDGTNDDATLWYFDGASWSLLDPLAKPSLGSCAPLGLWTAFSISLPASANNNPNVKIGFRWVNNIDGIGTDPSFAVDDITLSSPTTGVANYSPGNFSFEINFIAPENKLNIITNQEFSLAGIYDLLGNAIPFHRTGNAVFFSQKLSSQIYFIQVKCEGGIITKKFVSVYSE